MKNINLYRLWEISNLIYESAGNDDEIDNPFSYPFQNYEYFLERYSFKVHDDIVEYYVDDPLPYENWLRDTEHNFIPLHIYNGTDDEIKNWAIQEVKKVKDSQVRQKENRIAQLERELKTLKTDGFR